MDGGGRRREAALQDLQREADILPALVVRQRLSARFISVADVVGDRFIELRFGVRQFVVDGISPRSGNSGVPSNRAVPPWSAAASYQTHPPCARPRGAALEPVRIE